MNDSVAFFYDLITYENLYVTHEAKIAHIQVSSLGFPF